MTVAEYMNLRCLCGLMRREHVHAYGDLVVPNTEDPSIDLPGVINPHPTDLRVVGMQNDCRAFTWEMERELTGNPLANKHLRPLMVEGD